MNNPLSYKDPSGLDCAYYNSDGDYWESIDQNSDSGECGTNGGDWINGTINGGSYNSSTDTFTFTSSDSNNNYTTMAYAPGTESDGTYCGGNCDTPNGYSQTPFGLGNFYTGAQITPSTISILNAPKNNQQQPQRKSCPPGTRAAGMIEAASGAGDAAGSFALAGVHVGAAIFLVGAGCLEPTPAEPATCLASGFAAISLSGGAGVLSNLAILQVKEEVIPGIQQAITCVP